MVNAGTQIRAATAPFISLGCCRNATARGRSAPFVPEVIPGNTSRSLCSAAGPQGTSRSPMVTQFTAGCTGLQPSSLRGESGPNSAMKNNPGFINTVEKKKVRADSGWLCISQHWAWGGCSPLSPTQAQLWSSPAEPPRGMQTYPILPGGS